MEDKYMAGEVEDYIIIKFIGNSTMKNSKSLEEYLKDILKEDGKNIIFDFEECNYIDSTVLGVIAKIALILKKGSNKRIYEFNSSNMVRSSLNSTGVFDLLEHLKEDIDNARYQDLKKRTFTSDSERAKHILEAHKTLMGLSKENERIFKDIVKLLDDESN